MALKSLDHLLYIFMPTILIINSQLMKTKTIRKEKVKEYVSFKVASKLDPIIRQLQ